MGMFDQEVPQTLTPIQQLQMSSKRLGNVFAPAVEKATGYISPEREMRRVAAETDLSDSDAVQKTFNFLMSKNPQAAASWLKSVKPTIDYHIAQQKKPTMTDFDKKLALYNRDPKRFKELQEAGVFGKGGITVNVGGEDTEFSFKDVSGIENVWKGRVGDVKKNKATAQTLKTLAQQAKDGNAQSYNALQTQFSQFVGDSRISEGEIIRQNKAGSLPLRVANSFKTILTGTPTEKTLDNYLDVVDNLEQVYWNRLNYEKKNLMNVYTSTTTDEGKKKRILDVITPLFDIGQDPSTYGSKQSKEAAKQLCILLKKASDSGDTATAQSIANGLKAKGINSCEGL